MNQFKALFIIMLSVNSFALAEEFLITNDFCDQYMVEYTAAADVNYDPANEEAIGPPADIEGAKKIKLPKTIQIPIKFDLEKYFGFQDEQNPQSQINNFIEFAKLGYITVNDDGRLYFNNQPLFNEDEQRIKEACRKLKTQGNE